MTITGRLVPGEPTHPPRRAQKQHSQPDRFRQEAMVSAQELQRLRKDAEADPSLKAEIARELSLAEDAVAASETLKARGYDLSADELQPATAGAGELNDDALDRVVGGTGSTLPPFVGMVFSDYAHA
ncbi:Nif11-like leader peptide family natural product precursor [Azospirillum sp. SYSU D00513]|uniref:Nif11-like leader peptide family natural product precursor n=2 Tax=Pseudomonadati TaxID=3379134 RepID=UPI001A95FD87|nr:Nif11-like leader peptide family natural product precursor [Azospirillum sp. SYSU D00513]